jgi:hypothetical protein
LQFVKGKTREKAPWLKDDRRAQNIEDSAQKQTFNSQYMTQRQRDALVAWLKRQPENKRRRAEEELAAAAHAEFLHRRTSASPTGEEGGTGGKRKIRKLRKTRKPRKTKKTKKTRRTRRTKRTRRR